MSVDTMIAQMERWLGTGEPNEIQTWYRARNGAAYVGNWPWCNATITRAAVDAGEYEAVCFGTDYAYTVAHAARFKEAGAWHPMTNGIKGSGIRRGDIVFFDWGGTSEIAKIDHVGIVTGVSPDFQYVYTIEGNTANVCARRLRVVDDIAGFGRPKYKTPPKQPASSGTKRPQVSLARLVKASKVDPPKKGTPVSYKPTELVERALVAEKLLAAGYADGHFGLATRSAYSLLQQRLGYTGTQPGGDADGTPGMTSLKWLGKRHGFDVVA